MNTYYNCSITIDFSEENIIFFWKRKDEVLMYTLFYYFYTIGTKVRSQHYS
jgi:hypothetical protein